MRPGASRWRGALAAAVALVLLVVAALVELRRPRAGVAGPVELTVSTPPQTPIWSMFSLSPDGRHLALVSGEPQSLWIAPLANRSWRAVEGIGDANAPFWSADSRFVAYLTGRKVRKVSAAGGAPVDICDAPWALGGAWTRDDRILLGSFIGPISQVPAAGGVPMQVTRLQPGETSHRWPWLLPDGAHFLFLATIGDRASVRLGSLTTPETQLLIAQADSHAVYANGHLFFVKATQLMAQPFDADRRQLGGRPFPVADHMAVQWLRRGPISASDAGVLAYRSGLPSSRLTWMDRTGATLGTLGVPGDYYNLDLSSDDRRVAVSGWSGIPSNPADIFVFDVLRSGSATRVTSHPGREHDPVWSPDDASLLFNSERTGRQALFRRASDGIGADELLVQAQGVIIAPDWSPDGKYVAYSVWVGSANIDLWILPLFGAHYPRVFLQTSSRESSPAFSPDGQWLAYESDVSGRLEVYVRPFRTGAGEVAVSRSGGWAPRWRGDGKELFFLSLDGAMMAATVDPSTVFRVREPQRLFEAGISTTPNYHPYDVSRDGQRFIFPRKATSEPPITIVSNWRPKTTRQALRN